MIPLTICFFASTSAATICFFFLRATAPSIQILSERWRSVNTAALNLSEIRKIIYNAALVYFYVVSFLSPEDELAELLSETRHAALVAMFEGIAYGILVIAGFNRLKSSRLAKDYKEMVDSTEFLTLNMHPQFVKTFSCAVSKVV